MSEVVNIVMKTIIILLLLLLRVKNEPTNIYLY